MYISEAPIVGASHPEQKINHDLQIKVICTKKDEMNLLNQYSGDIGPLHHLTIKNGILKYSGLILIYRHSGPEVTIKGIFWYLFIP